MSLKDVLRATFHAQEHLLPEKQKFDPRVCQCCGYFRKRDEDPECVCDGEDWFLGSDGRVECRPHKWARGLGLGKTVFVVKK